MILTIIALLIVISIVVSVHEFGHFWAARWAGVKVEVFSVGFGKPIIKWHDKHGTEWRIAWIPLGGFVSIYGQNDMFNRKKYSCLSPKEKIGHYLSAPAWKQAVVIGAGVFMNLVSAWAIYTGLFCGTQTIQLPVIGQTEHASLKVGDRIMRVNDTEITSWSEMLVAKQMSTKKDIQLFLLRGDKLAHIQLPNEKWGISPDAKKIETIRYGLFEAMGKGAAELWTQSKTMFVIIGQMISGERSSKQLGGLIRIAEISGQALSAGFADFLAIIALLSVNLGIINLFPFPVLDGGYLLILLIEAVTRRKMHGRVMDWMIRIGWWLLIALMVFAFWNDVARLIAK
jgi:regulator of sigma E protease